MAYEERAFETAFFETLVGGRFTRLRYGHLETTPLSLFVGIGPGRRVKLPPAPLAPTLHTINTVTGDP